MRPNLRLTTLQMNEVLLSSTLRTLLEIARRDFPEQPAFLAGIVLVVYRTVGRRNASRTAQLCGVSRATMSRWRVEYSELTREMVRDAEEGSADEPPKSAAPSAPPPTRKDQPT